MTAPVLQKIFTRLGFAVLSILLAFALYIWAVLSWSYSEGERAGFLQKVSYKGWICKTWEGEQIRALAVMPTIPEKLEFTVRDVAIADQINASIGKKVVLEYEQHQGLPGCFGDTQHFVVAVRPAPGE